MPPVGSTVYSAKDRFVCVCVCFVQSSAAAQPGWRSSWWLSKDRQAKQIDWVTFNNTWKYFSILLAKHSTSLVTVRFLPLALCVCLWVIVKTVGVIFTVWLRLIQFYGPFDLFNNQNYIILIFICFFSTMKIYKGAVGHLVIGQITPIKKKLICLISHSCGLIMNNC